MPNKNGPSISFMLPISAIKDRWSKKGKKYGKWVTFWRKSTGLVPFFEPVVLLSMIPSDSLTGGFNKLDVAVPEKPGRVFWEYADVASGHEDFFEFLTFFTEHQDIQSFWSEPKMNVLLCLIHGIEFWSVRKDSNIHVFRHNQSPSGRRLVVSKRYGQRTSCPLLR